MTTTENTQVLVDTAQAAVQPTELHPGIFYVPNRSTPIDLREQIEAGEADGPRRKTGGYHVSDVEHFLEYLTKHRRPETEAWADVEAGTVRAVINAHSGDAAGWEDHAITLLLHSTDDWKEWLSGDGRLRPQVEFAEFIEDHLPNFVNPSAAVMLELAQTFQATTRVDFSSSQRVKSGETQIQYVESQNATAGRHGSLTIPDTFEVALQPFENGPAYKLEARFRYRIADGHLLLGYRLNRPKDARRLAFTETLAKVIDTGQQVWLTR